VGWGRIDDRDCCRRVYKGFRFAPEIISHGVWLYHRFPLSLRDVQELMLERGVDVSYETIRAWCASGSASSTRTGCAVAVCGRATNGTWMRCSSRSAAHAVPVARGRLPTGDD
jgi:hypothetical protein